MKKSVEMLSLLLANTYALYLKTQNYHWHVKGPNFKSFHDLFEAQYNDLFTAIDDLAERIRTLGALAPATFAEFTSLKSISDGDSKYSSNEMVIDLAKDNQLLISQLHTALEEASNNHDEGTIALLSERIAAHEKAKWMLEASKES